MMRSALVLVLLTVTALSSAHARPLGRLPRVVDSEGRFVGGLHSLGDRFFASTGGYILRKEGDPPVLVELNVTPSRLGATHSFRGVVFDYETADCSGTRYVQDNTVNCHTPRFWKETFVETADSDPLPPTVFYGDEAVTITVQSTTSWVAPGTCQNYGGTVLPDPINDPDDLCCIPQSPSPRPVCSIKSFQLPTFTPPFRAK